MASRSARAAGQTDAARGGAQSFVRNGSASASHQRRISAGLQQFGWAVGSNVQIEYRWSAGNEDDTRKYALELVALAPEVIFALGSQTVGPLQRATRTAADLPVQLSVKYETVLNMTTAKALGLDVPTSILLSADELIE